MKKIGFLLVIIVILTVLFSACGKSVDENYFGEAEAYYEISMAAAYDNPDKQFELMQALWDDVQLSADITEEQKFYYEWWYYFWKTMLISDCIDDESITNRWEAALEDINLIGKNPDRSDLESLLNSFRSILGNYDRRFSAGELTYNKALKLHNRNDGTDSDEIKRLLTLANGYADSNELLELYAFEYIDCGDGTVLVYSYSGREKNVEIPSIFRGLKVVGIESGAFKDCNLDKLILPEGITNIYSGAFENASIKSIVIPTTITQITTKLPVENVYISDIDKWCGIDFSYPITDEFDLYLNDTLLYDAKLSNKTNEIKDYAFSGCVSLRNLEATDALFSIGEYAFDGCINLKTVDIGNNLEKIGKDAFRNCLALTSITIPESVEEIGYDAFLDCQSITELRYNAINCVCETSTFASLGLAGTGTHIIIGKDVVQIPDSLFSQNAGDGYYYENSIVSIIFEGNKCKTIGNRAFSDCDNLMELVLPDSLEEIGEYAFWHCSSLEELIVPVSVTQIGRMAFALCTDVETLYFNAANCPNSEDNVFACLGSNTMGAKLVFGKDVTVVPYCMLSMKLYRRNYDPEDIPNITCVEFHEECVCNRIEAYSFAENTVIQTVILPKNLIEIGEEAFSDCTGIREIFIPNSVTTIERWGLACSTATVINCEAAEQPSNYDNYWTSSSTINWNVSE